MACKNPLAKKFSTIRVFKSDDDRICILIPDDEYNDMYAEVREKFPYEVAKYVLPCKHTLLYVMEAEHWHEISLKDIPNGM